MTGQEFQEKWPNLYRELELSKYGDRAWSYTDAALTRDIEQRDSKSSIPAERSEKCAACDTATPKWNRGVEAQSADDDVTRKRVYAIVLVDGTTLRAQTSVAGDVYVRIKFCPFCGARL